ncbi:MAG: hypothetical protein AAF206_29275 [Bacteroidota bacterium]
MQKRLLLFLLLPFVVIACEEDLINVSFNYDFDSSFKAPIHQNVSEDLIIESEEFDLEVARELDERNLASMTAVKLESVQLDIPADEDINWDAVKSLQLSMIIDGISSPLASLPEGHGNLTKSLNLQIDAGEVQLMQFLDKETAQLKLVAEMNEALSTEIEVGIKVNVKITAVPAN